MAMPKYSKYFAQGEIIFSEGDEGDCAYIIEGGQVQITLRKNSSELPISILEVGEIFGEMAIMDGLPRSATAFAASDCRLRIVTREQIQERIDEADSVVQLLVAVLIKRMRMINRNVSGGKANTSSPHFSPLSIALNMEKIDESKIIEQIRFETELHEAFANDEFVLFYQPIIEMKSGNLAGFEALIRWKSPTRGLVRPDLFIPIIEETSLMIPVGRWIQQTAMYALATMNKAIQYEQDHSLFMSINVSPKQLLDPIYIKDLENSRSKAGVDSADVKLEVTEKVLMEDAAILTTFQSLRQLGYSITLDDFGTGYSSLSYLGRFPVDYLKVDRTFVKELSKDHRCVTITQAIISLARTLGSKSVGEGIETKQDYMTLLALGCDFGQGFLFGKPVPLEDCLKLMKSWSLKEVA